MDPFLRFVRARLPASNRSSIIGFTFTLALTYVRLENQLLLTLVAFDEDGVGLPQTVVPSHRNMESSNYIPAIQDCLHPRPYTDLNPSLQTGVDKTGLHSVIFQAVH